MDKKNWKPRGGWAGRVRINHFLLQLHNLGLLSLGPVLAMGVIFGGLAQFIAGFQEQKQVTILVTALLFRTVPFGLVCVSFGC